MQAIHLIWISAAALAGLTVGAAGSRWLGRQKLEQLQQRLARSEEARNGAVERSAHAREQIAQLSKAISELRKSHQPTRGGAAAQPAPAVTAEQRRAIAERALAAAGAHGSDGDDEQEAQARSGVVLFANTQPLEL